MSAGGTAERFVVLTHPVAGRTETGPAQLRTLPEARPARAELLEAVRGASVVVSMFSDRVDDEFLDAAGAQLLGVCNYAVGYDNIDVEACVRRGVMVCNTPGAVTEGTADLAWALLLAVARRVGEADRFVRDGSFERTGPLLMTEFLGMDLTGRTLLIVGAGRIGYATALRSIGWGMRVLYVARSRHIEFELAPLAGERVSLEEGLERADMVSVHTPLTPETRHLIGAEQLERMKESAILVNTSRGPVVDESALVEALRAGRIWGAGLDVFEDEPRVHPGLAELNNVVLTPHIGSGEVRYRELMTEVCFENVRAILEGVEPPNRVC